MLITVTHELRGSIHRTSLITQFNNSRFIILLRSVSAPTATRTVTGSLRTAAADPVIISNQPLRFNIDYKVTIRTKADGPSLTAVSNLLSSTSSTVCTTGRAKHNQVTLFRPTRQCIQHSPRLVTPTLHATTSGSRVQVVIRPVITLNANRIDNFRAFIH